MSKSVQHEQKACSLNLSISLCKENRDLIFCAEVMRTNHKYM